MDEKQKEQYDEILEIKLKPGQGITQELLQDAIGIEDIDNEELGEPDEIKETKIVFKTED